MANLYSCEIDVVKKNLSFQMGGKILNGYHIIQEMWSTYEGRSKGRLGGIKKNRDM